MPRYVRSTAILLELETTYGVDPVPTAGADALLASNLGYPDFVANNVDRGNIKPYFGSDQQLVGTHYQKCSFDLEIAGSGTAGTAPAWAKALLACGFSETLVAATYAEYKPLTDNQPSCTIYWYDSGVFHKLTGAKGTVKPMLKVGEKPVLHFEFTGIYNTLTAAAVPAVTLTAWQQPLVATDSNTADLTFGATYAAGAITGGTTYPSLGLETDVANKVDFTPLIGRESVEITDRQAALSITLELTAAQEVSFMADVLANTYRAISMQHGLVAGNTVLIHAPQVQLFNPKKAALNDVRLLQYDGRLVPTTAGNDELVIVAK